MRWSLRSFLVLPFLLLFLGAAALIGWAGFRAGQESLEQFQRQLAAEVGGRISAHLERFFSVPALVVAANVEAMRIGTLDPRRLEDLQRHFVGQISHFPYLTFVSFGGADGQYVGATRIPEAGEIRLMTALTAEGSTLDVYGVGDDGRRALRLLRGQSFDARTRGWFRQAETGRRAAWYPVYKYRPYDSLGVGISAPVHDAQGRLLGVVAGDVALAQVARYLRMQTIGRSGLAFVAEPDGGLIATSLADPVYRIEGDKAVRFAIAEHADARIAAAGRWLRERGMESGQQFLDVGGERILLDVRRFREGNGLDLLVGVLLPERDHAGVVQANVRLVAWLTLGIAALGALVGVVLSVWLARPLNEINRRAERIAGGEWPGDIERPSVVREFAELGRSFNTMATRLRDAFTGLEARVAERTRALAEVNAELERLAALDGLTRIANRRRFDAVLQQEWRRCQRESQPLSVLMLDVDEFKAYNDEYGHLAGDEVLVRIAAVCEGRMQRATDVAARYGGEEFAVILPATDAEGARQVAESIARGVGELGIAHRRATAAPFVTVSIGVATAIPENGATPDNLVGGADRALYVAKRAGRNRIVVDGAMEPDTQRAREASTNGTRKDPGNEETA